MNKSIVCRALTYISLRFCDCFIIIGSHLEFSGGEDVFEESPTVDVLSHSEPFETEIVV